MAGAALAQSRAAKLERLAATLSQAGAQPPPRASEETTAAVVPKKDWSRYGGASNAEDDDDDDDDVVYVTARKNEQRRSPGGSGSDEDGVGGNVDDDDGSAAGESSRGRGKGFGRWSRYARNVGQALQGAPPGQPAASLEASYSALPPAGPPGQGPRHAAGWLQRALPPVGAELSRDGVLPSSAGEWSDGTELAMVSARIDLSFFIDSEIAENNLPQPT
jgi:hypothetical protein